MFTIKDRNSSKSYIENPHILSWLIIGFPTEHFEIELRRINYFAHGKGIAHEIIFEIIISGIEKNEVVFSVNHPEIMIFLDNNPETMISTHISHILLSDFHDHII